MTQKEQILNHLKKYKNGISSMEAFEKYGITRLSAVIYDLKHDDDIDIDFEDKITRDRYGKTKIYRRYKLDGNLGRN